MHEIEQGLTPMVSICTELPIKGNFLDNLWMTPQGGIILGECKLVRNPQSRREVVVQALDYAATMTGWTYDEFERAVGKQTGGRKLWDFFSKLGDDNPDAEAEFIDAVQRRLRDGQFMLLLVLDGIQDGLETLHGFLQQHAGLHLNVAIVEMSLWTTNSQDLLVIPRVPLKTKLIERGIVVNSAGPAIRIVEPNTNDRGQALPRSFTASEAEFYDLLDRRIPGTEVRLKSLIPELAEYGISPEFRRSPILRWTKSQDQQGSLGYIDSYGAAWLGDAYYSASKFGNEPAGRSFLEEIAAIVGGSVQWPTATNSQLAVRGRSGKIVRVDELLDHAAAWKQSMSRLTAAVQDAKTTASV